MKNRPLIAVAVLYIIGILLAGLPIPLLPLFIVSFGLLLLFPIWTNARRVLVCALIVLTGWINLAHRTAILAPNDLRTSFGDNHEPVTVRGVLRETPYHRVHEKKGEDTWSSMAQIEVSEFHIKEQVWQPASGRVMANTAGMLPEEFFAGRSVEVKGVLEPASGPVAEGLFDYRKYLDNQGIYHQLHVTKVEDWKITSPPAKPPAADRFCAWARKALARGLPVEDESLRLEWALTLGWKAALTDEISEPFIRAATYHIFAVDGLRIAIVSGILLTFLRMAGVPRVYCGMLAVPLICFYAAMTGWPASAIRAIVMIMVVFGGWALNRPSDLINSLFAAAIIILVWEPRQIFQAGFQLSFFVVFCIILILPFFDRIGERLLEPDPLLPESLRPRWQKVLHVPARWVIDLFLTSVAAWLGSIPLVAWYFHLFTPLSGLANVIAVPLCGLVLISDLASLLLASWFPFAAELFDNAGWFCMECIEKTSQWSANWPGAFFYLPMPALFTIGAYYVILIAVLTGWLFKGSWRRWKMAGAVVLVLGWCGLWVWQRPTTRLTILPTGGGYAAYLQSPGNGNDWLIDCGNESSVASVVKPFLRAQGVNSLPNFVLTHGEILYSGGAESLYNLFRPGSVYTSPIPALSPDYRKFKAKTRNDSTTWKQIHDGDRAGPWEVLYPKAKSQFLKGNDNALVMRAEVNHVRVLLLSDLGHPGQNALLALTNDLRADIVVAGLPDQSEPVSEALLNAVQPRIIIISDSPAKRANSSLRRRLLRRHLPVLYTIEARGITLISRHNHWELSAMDGTTISGDE